MKNRILALLLVVAMMLTLAACGCKHDWEDADCENPKTCNECGETEGEALGHDWEDATCDAPKTCKECGETEGEALEHIWHEATTDAPKTCELCGLTDGERIITDERFTTASCQDLFGTWELSVMVDGEMMGVDEFSGEFEMNMILTLNNDGTMSLTDMTVDTETFNALFLQYLVDVMNQTFEEAGLDQETADAMFQEQYGMTVEEYCQTVVDQTDITSILGDMETTGVYYVEDGLFYSADNWNDTMEASGYTLDGDSLVLDELMDELGQCTLTRITE